MKRLILIGLALGVAGCIAVETTPVRLRNASGMTAQCGPYGNAGAQAISAAPREAQCVADFQKQGYQRVSD